MRPSPRFDSRPSVLISGAGVAGPTLAYWLLEGGLQPTLIERAPELRAGGYIIDFWGLGYDIAERMGLGDQLRAHGYNVRELRFLNGRGRRIGGFGAEVFEELTEGRYVSLPRSDLSRMIYGLVADRCEARFGDAISGLQAGDDGVVVAFETGGQRRFDLVIGADGLHSGVRGLAFGPEAEFERYLGYAVAAFEAQGYPRRDENVYVSYGRPGRQAARLALDDDRTLFLLVFAAEDPPRAALRQRSAQEELVRAAFGDAGWECPEILNAMASSRDLYFDLVSQIRLDHWSRGRVGLVGDAAFAPSLLAGQGSALAMIGAYVLAGELASTPGRPAAALERYQATLHKFMDDKQAAAEGFARSFAPRTALGLWFRNQVTRAFSIPGLARLTFGAGLLDRVRLPRYPELDARPPALDDLPERTTAPLGTPG